MKGPLIVNRSEGVCHNRFFQRTPRLSIALLFLVIPIVIRADVTIVDNGTPRASIVIAENPPRLTALAAQELQAYIQRISGAELPIGTAPDPALPVAVYVGRSSYTDEMGYYADGLRHGAFRIVSGPDRLVLLGHDADFEPVEPWAPVRSELQRAQEEWEALSGGTWQNPSRRILRGFHRPSGIWAANSASDEGGSLQAVYAFLRNLGVRWYMPGDLGEVLPSHSSITVSDNIDRTERPDFPYRNLRLGNTREFSWEDFVWSLRLGLNNDGLVEPHGMREILGNEAMQTNHPEYYALLGGKRDTTSRGTGHACFSSEGLLQETVAYSRATFDHFGFKAVSVFPQDGYRHCQCDRCQDKTPSEAVWEFVNTVAQELYKTHPDHLVLCGVYGSYRMPPDSIEQFSPNVVVRISWSRPSLDTQENWEPYWELVETWRDRLAPQRLMRNANVYNSAASEKFPIIFPRSIAREMSAMKGLSLGEDSSVPRSPEQRWLRPGLSHLNMYVTARYLWNADQDLSQLLDEYYNLFYGPAADSMRTAFEFAESVYPREGGLAPSRVPTADRVRFAELVYDAREVAGDTVYGERVQRVIDDLLPLEALREEHETSEDRGDVREFWTLMPADKRDWGEAGAVIDGRLDEPFWTVYPGGGSLLDSQTGAQPAHRTTFMMRWYQNHLYVGIRCEVDSGSEPVIGSNRNGDPAILEGDSVTLLLETQNVSYYEITINPAGAIFDADHSEDGVGDLWVAQAEVATHIGEDYWSAELRIPVTDHHDDPLHQIVGREPSRTYPWYFNIVRHHARHDGTEVHLWEQTGERDIHDPLTFGRIYLRPAARLRQDLRRDGVRTGPSPR